jgi:5-methylcytosine-specific restriction endonuclease McrA
MKEHQTRNHNPNWRGGIQKRPYQYPPEWKHGYQEKIRERDGRVCAVCGKSESENRKKLSVHHVDYNKQNLDESNLISLCISCHVKTNGNRQEWVEIFSAILRDREVVNG